MRYKPSSCNLEFDLTKTLNLLVLFDFQYDFLLVSNGNHISISTTRCFKHLNLAPLSPTIGQNF